MKIIKHPNTYICEICGYEHDSLLVAEACESYILPECKFNVGDKILCESRYEGYVENVVKSIRLVNKRNFNRICLADNKILEKLKTNIKFHEWIIYTEDEIEICKDGTTSDRWSEDEIYKIDNIIWNNNILELPRKERVEYDKILIKYKEDYLITCEYVKLIDTSDSIISWANIPN